jgi:hypothetical protein
MRVKDADALENPGRASQKMLRKNGSLSSCCSIAEQALITALIALAELCPNDANLSQHLF